MRRLVAALALGASLTAFAAPAAAGMRAFRTSDGREDPAFVRLDARSRVDRVIEDGAQGVYLVGRIVVNGGDRQIVHLRPNGTVDRMFRPSVRGGLLAGAALYGRELVLFGAFQSVGGKPRARIAVVDARTGRPLDWTPQLPERTGLYGISQAVFSRRMLVISMDGGLFAWRPGAAQPAWTRDYPYTLIASWHRSIWAIVTTDQQGARLATIDPTTGQTWLTSRNMHRVTALQVVGRRLIALARGSYWRVDHPGDPRLAACVQASSSASPGLVAVAVAGDARTLYAGNAPSSPDVPGGLPAVTACPWSGGSAGFRPPVFAYTEHGPIVSGLALVGTRVLVFTRTS